MNVRRRRKKRRISKLVILLVIILSLFIYLTKLYFEPPIMVYSKRKVYYYASVIINDAIASQIVPNIDTKSIIYLETKSNGQVSSVIVDVYQVNLLLSKMSKKIQDELVKLENDKNNALNKMQVPLGVIFDTPVLNIGPNIDIHINFVGNVHTDIISSVKPYGINNSLIEVMIKTVVTIQIILPFQTSELIVETHTPLLIKIIQGDIPYYYIGNSYMPPYIPQTN